MKNKILSLLCLLTMLSGFLTISAAAQQPRTPPNVASETAADILKKNVEALGGSGALAQIKSVERTIESSVFGKTIKTVHIEDIVGKRSYQKQDGAGGIIESGFDGKKAWQKAAFFRGYLDANSPQAKSASSDGIKLPGAALYNYRTSGKKFERLADEQLGGKNYLVVKSADTAADGKEIAVKYYFDPSDYLLKQTVSGDAVTQTRTYSDYRKVGGVMVAFAAASVNPQYTVLSTIIELKFNLSFDASIFEFQETPSQSKIVPHSSVDAPKQRGKAEPTENAFVNGELSESIRLETFENVWKTIDNTFYDRAFNGINWQSVHAKYLPQAKTTASSEDFHRMLNRMVQEFRLSHFKVVSPSSVITLSSGAANLNNGSVGLSLQWIENQLLVSAVTKDSSADLTGIRPGYVLERINGKTPAELYAAYQKENIGFQLREELARVRAASGELAGKADSKINVEFTDESKNLLKTELLLKAQSINNQLEFESKKLAGNVGFIKFNFFFGDLLTKFQNALQELKDTRALIIDLRGNPGGAGDLAPAMANLLSNSPGSLGSLKYRYATEQYSYKGAGKQAYKGKIIVLTDAGTGSTSEVFAGGMQANKLAAVIGSPSAGAVLPSLVALLPTGGALQYVVSNFQTSDGTTLEGKGIVPDINVKSTRAGLLAGRDEVLEQSLIFARK